MKYYLILTSIVLFSLSAISQSEKSIFYSKELTFTDPKSDKLEVQPGDYKITIDYDLKLIKVNYAKKELIYSYHNVEKRKIENERMFFEFDRGQEFEVMMLSIDGSKSYIMFAPQDSKNSASLVFTKLKILNME
jgi:hypothetical protein